MTTGSSGTTARTPFEGGVFISYRRAQAGPYAARLQEKLAVEYGEHRVFFDQDRQSIPKGPHFPEAIRQALSRADVILILVTHGWLDAVNQRMQGTDVDWVLEEAQHALARITQPSPDAPLPSCPAVHVVCLGGAVMPKASELPDSIKALADINSHQLTSDYGWNAQGEPFQRLMRDVRSAMPKEAPGFDLDGVWKTTCANVTTALKSPPLDTLADFTGLLELWQNAELIQQSQCDPIQALVDLKTAIADGHQARRLNREALSDEQARKVRDACLVLVAEWLRLGASKLASRPGVLGDGRRPAELEMFATHLFALATRDQRQVSLRFEPGTYQRKRQISVTRAIDQGTVTAGTLADKHASILDQLWVMNMTNKLADKTYSHDPKHADDVRDLASSLRSLNRERGKHRVTIAVSGSDPAQTGAHSLREWLASLKLEVDVIVRTGTRDAAHSQDEDDLIYPAWECLVQIEGIGCDAPK